MKDFLNQDLQVGDVVAIVRYGKNFSLATVLNFTAKKVRVKLHNLPWEELKNPHQLLKLSTEQVTWYTITR